VALESKSVLFRVRLENLLIGKNVPAGMNGYVVMGKVPHLRGTTEDEEPILVKHVSGDVFRISDGRHRFVASIIAGRSDILCKLDSDVASGSV
jgi:hypothetical protein